MKQTSYPCLNYLIFCFTSTQLFVRITSIPGLINNINFIERDWTTFGYEWVFKYKMCAQKYHSIKRWETNTVLTLRKDCMILYCHEFRSNLVRKVGLVFIFLNQFKGRISHEWKQKISFLWFTDKQLFSEGMPHGHRFP